MSHPPLLLKISSLTPNRIWAQENSPQCSSNGLCKCQSHSIHLGHERCQTQAAGAEHTHRDLRRESRSVTKRHRPVRGIAWCCSQTWLRWVPDGGFCASHDDTIKRCPKRWLNMQLLTWGSQDNHTCLSPGTW